MTHAWHHWLSDCIVLLIIDACPCPCPCPSACWLAIDAGEATVVKWLVEHIAKRKTSKVKHHILYCWANALAHFSGQPSRSSSLPSCAMPIWFDACMHCFAQSMPDSMSFGGSITFTTNVCTVCLVLCWAFNFAMPQYSIRSQGNQHMYTVITVNSTGLQVSARTDVSLCTDGLRVWTHTHSHTPAHPCPLSADLKKSGLDEWWQQLLLLLRMGALLGKIADGCITCARQSDWQVRPICFAWPIDNVWVKWYW